MTPTPIRCTWSCSTVKMDQFTSEANPHYPCRRYDGMGVISWKGYCTYTPNFYITVMSNRLIVWSIVKMSPSWRTLVRVRVESCPRRRKAHSPTPPRSRFVGRMWLGMWWTAGHLRWPSMRVRLVNYPSRLTASPPGKSSCPVHRRFPSRLPWNMRLKTLTQVQ